MTTMFLIHRIIWVYDGFAADRSLAELVSCYGFFVTLRLQVLLDQCECRGPDYSQFL